MCIRETCQGHNFCATQCDWDWTNQSTKHKKMLPREDLALLLHRSNIQRLVVRGGMKWTKRNPEILWSFGFGHACFWRDHPESSPSLSWDSEKKDLPSRLQKHIWCMLLEVLAGQIMGNFYCIYSSIELSLKFFKWRSSCSTTTKVHNLHWIIPTCHGRSGAQGLKGLQSMHLWLPSQVLNNAMNYWPRHDHCIAREASSVLLLQPLARWLFDRSINPISLRTDADPTIVEARVVSVVRVGLNDTKRDLLQKTSRRAMSCM